MGSIPIRKGDAIPKLIEIASDKRETPDYGKSMVMMQNLAGIDTLHYLAFLSIMILEMWKNIIYIPLRCW